MAMYPSSITFLYYEDLTYGRYSLQEVLGLPLVMDQGFAAIYEVAPTSFVGAVQRRDSTQVSGDTLISLNTTDLQAAYAALPLEALVDVTPIEHIPSIPLDSFFFSDREGHRFEIQQFVNASDCDKFGNRGQ